MASPNNLPRTLGKWPSGVDQVHDVRELQSRSGVRGEAIPALRAAVNVDITREGKLQRRRGYSEHASGYTQSLWSPDSAAFGLMVKDAQIQRLDPDGSMTALGAANPVRRMAYCEAADRVYLSNGIERFILDGALRAWGVDAPGLPAIMAASFGGLDAGTYKVNATAYDAFGEESGCGESATVTLTTGQGIMLDLIPNPPGAAWIQFYVSPPNGDVLYASKRLPAGITSYVLGRADLVTGKLLDTQFCERVPAASILCAFRGRIYFGVGSRLFYTLPLRYGLFKRHESYLPVPSDITGIVATNETMYVGTEKGVFAFGGDDPTSMQRRDVDGFGMVPGTATRLRRGDQISALWWSKEGVLYRAGSDGVQALTRNRLALPEFKAGAILHREQEGFSQLVSSLKGAGPSNTFSARDRFSAKVMRNGVVIN